MMIADDEPAVRDALTSLMAEDPEISVVGADPLPEKGQITLELARGAPRSSARLFLPLRGPVRWPRMRRDRMLLGR